MNPLLVLQSDRRIAVAYLARGADSGWQSSLGRFIDSYEKYAAGVDHVLHVLFKGFADAGSLRDAQLLFGNLEHEAWFLQDDSLDIGAYIEWANANPAKYICAFGTSSEILSDKWLQKLKVNLELPNVDLVGATGSYESLSEMSSDFPPFPNVHVRSNAFMIRRELFCELTRDTLITDKISAYQFENGSSSLTQRVIAGGSEVLVVGANGRGYAPPYWPSSGTFRQGTQDNLLVADNQTRDFAAMRWPDKQAFAARTWGKYILEMEYLQPRC
jgi:hypothetical protein